MKITIIAIAFFCLCSFYSFGQTASYTIKGSIADSTEKVKLAGTTVTVMNAKDSILRAFTWTATNGSFALNKLTKGKYLLLVSYPGYADYTDNFTLDSSKTTLDIGTINMILKSRLLADVLVKGEVTAIKIKGDTTEFNAKAYKIQPNDKVEDLLKQLPGIEVDKDGKITAQGQTVNKVLVDGEEFFGDDPTLVTKNIRADMVDKVQLYDKKSDQATFTGIDDGVKDKTINIKLKADKKNGYFGKADAGVGTDGYYEGQLLYNRFKANEKFSVYGTLGNDGKTGLGWEDSQKAGLQSDNMQFGDDGSIMIFGGGGDDLDSFDGRYNGQGTPLARTAGLHYDSKWNSDKETLNTNYKVGSIQVDGTNDNLNQQNFADSIIRSSSHQDFHKFMFRQKLDATYQLKLDTSQTLKFSVDGTDKHSDVLENNNSNSFLNSDTLNNNRRQVLNHINSKIFDASVFYTKKFKKVGRTFSWLIGESYNESDSRGFLKARTDYYKNNAIDSTQVTDQLKTLNTKSSVLNSNITYTEPLSKRWSVIANYGLSIDNGTSDRRTNDSTGIGQYNRLVDTLSNDYKLNQVSNQVGAIFNYKKDKATFNFGTKVADVSFTQTDAIANNTFKRHFIDWLPQASYQYRFSQQQSLRLSYNGNTTQPTISQLQPVADNSDNLNVTVGNPNLKPSFNNSINVNYNSYKVISGQSIGLYGNYSFVTDPIVSNASTDINTGKSVYKSVNLPGKVQTNFYGGLYMGQKVMIAKQDFRLGLDLNGNGSTSYNYTNGVLNTTNNYTYGGSLRISQYKVKKYDFNISFGPNYNISKSSLQSEVNNNGIGYQGYAGFDIYLPAKFQIASDGNYQFTGKTASFDQNFSKLLVNASLIKTFFKDDALKFSLSGNDLFNQNVGFSRNAYGNTISQNSYTTIKRFFMLSVSWDFNHMGGGVPKQ